MAADVVGAIADLSDLLSSADPSASELEQMAGGDPVFAEATVEDEDEPELVDLELAESVTLTVDQLAEAFGEPSPLPKLHPDRPSRVAFYVVKPGRPASVAVIASVDEDEGRVFAVTLRRDERGDDD